MSDAAASEAAADASRDRYLVVALLVPMLAYVLWQCSSFAARGMSVRQQREFEPDEVQLEALLETHDD